LLGVGVAFEEFELVIVVVAVVVVLVTVPEFELFDKLILTEFVELEFILSCPVT
jgi:hypothetical protein